MCGPIKELIDQRFHFLDLYHYKKMNHHEFFRVRKSLNLDLKM